MANDKKMVEQITSMEEDFAKWYTDIVKKADLIDYSSVKGCMIIRPYGYAIWENIQKLLDARFKATGVENIYMPMFIPESLLKKEKDHVEGFAPEVAWVTHGGSERLTERLCVRPTSETLFCEHYANIIKSYRDLPKLYNQWCSVVRWEKTTRPFLRSREFLWQEGHTMHATAEDAEKETLTMLGVYADFFEKDLGIPVLKGKKTDKEKFAGAKATYTVDMSIVEENLKPKNEGDAAVLPEEGTYDLYAYVWGGKKGDQWILVQNGSFEADETISGCLFAFVTKGYTAEWASVIIQTNDFDATAANGVGVLSPKA